MGGRSFEPEEGTCDICGKYTLVYDLYGDFVCPECINQAKQEEDDDTSD